MHVVCTVFLWHQVFCILSIINSDDLQLSSKDLPMWINKMLIKSTCKQVKMNKLIHKKIIHSCIKRSIINNKHTSDSFI